MLEAKFSIMRAYRNQLRKPFDADFNGIEFLPDLEEALFLDVGANRGQSTDAILMKRKKSRIQLFEPNPWLCGKLEAFFGSNPRIIVNRFALGAKTEERELFVPFYKHWMFDGLASFDEETAKSWLRDRMFFYREEFLTVKTVACKIRPLDDLALDPAFIKLDVQGFEYEVVRGGEETIRRCSPILLIESPPAAVLVEYLKGLGYEMYAFRAGGFCRGVMGGANTFFMRADKSAGIVAQRG
jgi:FkbM family methyltransferase